MTSLPSERALIDRIGASFATLFFCVQMFVLAKAGHAMPGIPILAVLALPFALYALAGTARVWLERDGVRIMNFGRQMVLDWGEIERFSLDRHGLLRRVGIAEMYDGRRIAIWGIQGPNAATRRSEAAAARLICAMNAELERRQTAGEALQPSFVPLNWLPPERQLASH